MSDTLWTIPLDSDYSLPESERATVDLLVQAGKIAAANTRRKQLEKRDQQTYWVTRWYFDPARKRLHHIVENAVLDWLNGAAWIGASPDCHKTALRLIRREKFSRDIVTRCLD